MTKVLKSARLSVFAVLAGCTISPAWSADLLQLTVQGKSFTLTTAATVSYGANSVFAQKTLPPGTYLCNDSFFGDPLWGVLKACYMPSSTQAVELQKLSNQNGSFTLAQTTTVSYGVNGIFNQKTLYPGTYTCTDQFFGDPYWGQLKSCYIPRTASIGATQMTQLVGQFNSFKLAIATVVSYGANGVFVEKSLPPGIYSCDDGLFGDPLWGVIKACYITAAAASSRPPDNTSLNNATNFASGDVLAVPGDVIVNGKISSSEYRTMAEKMGTEAAIAYRYGPSAVEYGNASQTGQPTYSKRASQSMKMVSVQNPNGLGNRNCGWTSWCGSWQIGGAPEYYWGDYSYNTLNFTYVADSAPEATHFQKSYAAAIGSIQTLAVGNNTTSVEPEASWMTYLDPSSDGASIDANIERYMGRRGGWGAAPLKLEKPVALAKCYGRGDWCVSSLAVYADGRIVSVGSATSHNMFTMQLPSGKVPTAITITNSGEFALITVWDTTAIKGQIAVLALGSSCQGCSQSNEGNWSSKWGNWKRVYPGAPGLGNYSYAKLIGFVDLPETIKAPTEISASTGLAESDYEYERVQNFFQTDLDNINVRARFAAGDLANSYARAGMAVVLSKSEKRAAFIDMRPLFAYYKRQYFTQPQSAFNAMIANRGEGPSQWPYSFDVVADQKPNVVKVVDMDNRPTAVRVSLQAPYRAFIATQEGKLRVFDLGSGYLNPAGGGTPYDILEKFSVYVGKNPTSITYVKDRASGQNTAVKTIYPNTAQKELIVTSRGERKIQWVRFDENFSTGSVVRTLTESRIIDPISTEDNNNHGTESYLVTIADYFGKGIHNFLYGPIIWHTFEDVKACSSSKSGCQMLNGADFEYGGTFKTPGKPFQLGLANST